MSILIYSAIGLCSFWLLWVFFLAVMALKRARDEGKLVSTSPAYKLGMSVLFVGWVLDFLVNLLISFIPFLEFPSELTVTARVTRLKREGGWRGKLTTWMCIHILDPFEIGGHCK